MGGVEEQIYEAEKKAKEKLAEAISQRIQSNQVIFHSNTYAQGKNSSSHKLNSDLQSTTNVLVKNSTITDRWLDRKGCYYWVRAVISVEEVQKIQKAQKAAFNSFNVLEKHTRQSEDSYITLEKRDLALNEAKNIFDTVDFNLLNDSGIIGISSTVYWDRLQKAGQMIKTKQQEIIDESDRKEYRKYIALSEKHYQNSIEKYKLNSPQESIKEVKKAIGYASKIDVSVLNLSHNIYLEKYKRKLKWYKETNIQIGDEFIKIENLFGQYNDAVCEEWNCECLKRGRPGFFLGAECYQWSSERHINVKKNFCVKYGNNWFVFSNGCLDCVIKEEYFKIGRRGEPGSYDAGKDEWGGCDDYNNWNTYPREAYILTNPRTRFRNY